MTITSLLRSDPGQLGFLMRHPEISEKVYQLYQHRCLSRKRSEMNFDPSTVPKYWLGNSCYRQPPFHYPDDKVNEESDQQYRAPQHLVAAVEEPDEPDSSDSYPSSGNQSNAVAESAATNNPADTGPATVEVNIPNEYRSFIIGRQGMTKKQMERDTNTVISLPERGQEGMTTVTGSNAQNVQSCLTRIQMKVQQARDRHQFTHFVSIPLEKAIGSFFPKERLYEKQLVIYRSDADIGKTYEEFSKLAVEMGVAEGAMQKPGRLHITAGLLTLVDKTEIEAARTIMEEVVDGLKNRLKESMIKVSGIEIMNDDPSAVDIVFGKIFNEKNQLSQFVQDLAQSVQDSFAESGFYKDDGKSKGAGRSGIKAHCTLINSKYLISPTERKPRPKIDVTEVLSVFSDFEFGQLDFDDKFEIHLSERSGGKPLKFYKPAAVFKF